MGLRSHRSVEEDVVATLPNGLTATRAVGGMALGTALAVGGVDPGTAFVATIGLALTDLEGLTISLTNRWPRLQRALRIIPSKLGRNADPVADKIFASSVVIGGMIGGEIPLWQGGSIMATELATAATTLAVRARGGDPEVSTAGTWGTVARFAAIAADLGASAVGAHSGFTHEFLSTGADVLTPVAVGLGAVSCGTIFYQFNHRENSSPEVPVMPPLEAGNPESL